MGDAGNVTRSDVPPAPVEPAHLTGAGRFFAWLRGLGLVRTPGWIGGVSGAIAGRARIDPVIVRGLFVVSAVLGLPALLVYGVLWALLPDERGEIHAENMLRGRFDPPLVAALVIVALGIVPVVGWLVDVLLQPLSEVLGTAYFNALPVFQAVSAGAFVVLGVVVAVALVRSTASARRRRAAATVIAQSDLALSASSAPAFDASLPGVAAGASPTPAGTGLAYEEWRRQHQAWLAQHDAWRESQPDAERTARTRADAEQRRRRAELAEQAAAASAARRAANPRTNFGFVVLVLGVSAVAAAGTAILTAPYGTAVALAGALFAAGIVAAVGMVVAGILRRRSGFISAVAVVAILSGIGMAVYAAPFVLSPGREGVARQLSPLGDWVALGDGDYVQLRGMTFIDPPVTNAGGRLTLAKGRGDTYITVPDGATLHITADLGYGDLTVQTVDAVNGFDSVVNATPRTAGATEGSQSFDLTIAGAKVGSRQNAVYSVDISQLVGNVYVQVNSQEAR